MEQIRASVGERKVFLLASGGVDSTVSFALLTRTLGPDRVRGLFVNTGFMRMDEEQEIREAFAQLGYDNLEVVDASKDFLADVAGIDDPEEKRKRIGARFLALAERYRTEHGYAPPEWMLAQGTIYPDTIESGGTRNAETIKTHHNRVEEVQDLLAANEIIEPIAELYKDEVRELGRALKIPDRLLMRHPFPGPGLAIRILTKPVPAPGGLEQDIRRGLQRVRPDLPEHFRFRVLPVASVGVQGDRRSYAHPLAISGPLYWETLREISKELLRMYKLLNRAVFLLNPQSGVLEEAAAVPLAITPESVEMLQRVDRAVKDFFWKEELAQDLWQVPVVLIPVGAGGRPSVVVRPVVSREAMTVTPFELTENVAQGLVRAVEQSGQPISGIFYDITDKPPGTIEWE
jgi:GMP synthase (glutamine-hydrolysing)